MKITAFCHYFYDKGSDAAMELLTYPAAESGLRPAASTHTAACSLLYLVWWRREQKEQKRKKITGWDKDSL